MPPFTGEHPAPGHIDEAPSDIYVSEDITSCPAAEWSHHSIPTTHNDLCELNMNNPNCNTSVTENKQTPPHAATSTTTANEPSRHVMLSDSCPADLSELALAHNPNSKKTSTHEAERALTCIHTDTGKTKTNGNKAASATDGGGDSEEECEAHARWQHAAYHITTVMVGTGVLGLPQAMAQLTWIPGLLAILVSFLASFYTAHLLCSMHYTHPDPESRPRRLSTYRALGEYVLGKRNANLFVVPFQYLVLVGASIVYLIVSSENIGYIYEHNCGDNCVTVKHLLWTSVVAGMQLLLTLFPSLESISMVSALAAFMSLGYCFIAVALSFYTGRQPTTEYGFDNTGTTTDSIFAVFSGLSTVAFAFGMHAMLPEIVATLAESDTEENPSQPSKEGKSPKMEGVALPIKEGVKAVSFSWLLAAVLYFSSAVAGYWALGREVASDVLLSIADANKSSTGVHAIVTVAMVMVVVHVVIAYQVLSLPVHVALERFVCRRYPAMRKQRKYVRMCVRFLYVSCTWFVAISLPFFGNIMSFFGAVGMTPITFILPCVLFLKYASLGYGSEDEKGTKESGLSVAMWERWLPYMVISLFSLIGVVGCVGSLYQIVQSSDKFSLFS